MKRRNFLSFLSATAGTLALPPLALANSPAAGLAPFSPWLVPFKGVSDASNGGDLDCAALRVTGKLPAGLKGRFYRNGPALFERGGQRYQHWFDGDGMVQQFSFTGNAVTHRGRLVRTPKLLAERKAGEFRYPTFGTAIANPASVNGPDGVNTANTNAIEHAGRLLAMWEGGSAVEMNPADMSTIGPVTWQDGYQQVPFSAHPKLDAQGNLWNIGTFGNKIIVWHINSAGKLERVQMTQSPYSGGMAHDMAVTAQYIVLPLPPIKLNFAAIARGKSREEAFALQTDQPLRVLVMHKADISRQRVFELPPEMLFHAGNAYERADGRIALSYVASRDTSFLSNAAVSNLTGQLPSKPSAERLSTVLATLDMSSGKTELARLEGTVEFPRIDPRYIGQQANFLLTAASWRTDLPAARPDTLFHGIQLLDIRSAKVQRYDYGASVVVEEHIVVPKPGRSAELDAWVVGTSFSATTQRTSVSVFEAKGIANGPIASAELPYWLPLGFHGNFTAV